MNRTTIYLHRSDLVDHGACEEGLLLFDEFAAAQGRKRSLRIPLAGLLWAACDPRAREFLCWAQVEGLLPRVNAPGADLRGADLSDAYLSDAYLYSANFMDACLYGAYFYGADIRLADFCGADLRGAELRKANLYGADLSGARRLNSDPPIDGWVTRDGVLVRA